jgi:hypothetical protein
VNALARELLRQECRRAVSAPLLGVIIGSLIQGIKKLLYTRLLSGEMHLYVFEPKA